MWIKDNTGRWIPKETTFNIEDFSRTLDRLKTYSKCINASTYSVTNNLDNIYSDILYQHGFYIEFLESSPENLIISGVILEKNKLYNLSLTHSKDVIINNELDYLITTDEETGYLQMTIRTAIAMNYVKAANSLLFIEECGFVYWEDYISNNIFYNENPNYNCYLIDSGTSGTSGILNYNNEYDYYDLSAFIAIRDIIKINATI